MDEPTWLTLLDERPDPYPGDAYYWLLRTQFADWLEEHDREDEAHAWRHVVRTGRISADCQDLDDSHYRDPAFVWFSEDCGYSAIAHDKNQYERAVVQDEWLEPMWDRLYALQSLTQEFYDNGARKPTKFGREGVVAVSSHTHVAAELALVHALIATGSHKEYSR